MRLLSSKAWNKTGSWLDHPTERVIHLELFVVSHFIETRSDTKDFRICWVFRYCSNQKTKRDKNQNIENTTSNGVKTLLSVTKTHKFKNNFTKRVETEDFACTSCFQHRFETWFYWTGVDSISKHIKSVIYEWQIVPKTPRHVSGDSKLITHWTVPHCSRDGSRYKSNHRGIATRKFTNSQFFDRSHSMLL